MNKVLARKNIKAEAGGVYHCAEKNNGNGAGDHYCVVLQLSVSQTSELHHEMTMIHDINEYKDVKTRTTKVCI